MSKKKASIAECKKAWEEFPVKFPDRKHSGQNVVKQMQSEGFAIAQSTFARWRSNGWHPDKPNAKTSSENLSKDTPKHEQKLTRLDVIEMEEALMKAEREKLLAEVTLDSELARQALRESLVAQIVLARQIVRRASVLVEIAPEVAAKLLLALKEPLASTTIIIPPNEAPASAPGNGDGAKVVDGKVIEKSVTQMAIERFKQRQTEGVAA